MDILFKFVHYSFSLLSKAKREDFVRGLRSEAEREVARQMEMIEENLPADLVKVLPGLKQFQEKQLKSKFRGRNHTQYGEWVTDGMTSAEVLFRITVFEDFLKHVHAAILIENPKVFACAKNKNRSATYEQIFGNSVDYFKEQLVCQEVAELDRDKMENRLSYFANHLKIDFGPKKNLLIEISKIRNKIAHGNPLSAITKDDTSIPLDNLRPAIADAIKGSMRAAFDKGHECYPRNFRER